MKEQMIQVDLLIIGGGCAGLSLANELSKLTSPPSTLILEPRARYAEDRTWCFWADQFSNSEQLPLQSWETVAVQADEHRALLSLDGNPYQRLRSLDFYRAGVRSIESSPLLTLRMGEAAGGSKKNEAGRWITKSESGAISSKFVVDTRPFFGGLAGSPALWQTFVGVEIEFDEDTFDPSTAELMRFLPSRNEDVRFIYQLPESRRQGLFELTMLSIQRPTFEELKQQLTDELRNAFGGRNYRVIREEQGLIPMGIHDSGLSKDPSYVHVGVGSGSARPSTGYTFCRIQRWAKECARELGNGEPPIGPIDDTPLVRHMDTIFLQVLREHPQLAPEIFVRLFEKVPAARLLRFLGDSPRVIDAVSVVAALPKLPFLREVLAPKRKASPVADGVTCFR